MNIKLTDGLSQWTDCIFCSEDFWIDFSTGENLDIDNYTPICPECGKLQDKKLFEKTVDKTKTRSIIEKSKGQDPFQN